MHNETQMAETVQGLEDHCQEAISMTHVHGAAAKLNVTQKEAESLRHDLDVVRSSAQDHAAEAVGLRHQLSATEQAMEEVKAVLANREAELRAMSRRLAACESSTASAVDMRQRDLERAKETQDTMQDEVKDLSRACGLLEWELEQVRGQLQAALQPLPFVWLSRHTR
mmetsp:Transcript_13323/g.28679  ORF Transcript_13323/g.28679 Transcript_13323/m.28679 type:complete len:168 (+) Transcript_13323:354-857(+)